MKKDKIVFHFNKAHNLDQSIPPWIIKVNGETQYVNHIHIAPGLGFTTKETPDNVHTKASCVVKGTLTIVDGEAVIN
jgi:hypothetical protein